MDGTPAEEQPAAAPAPTGATEQEQEAKLRARYGGLVPKKGLLAVSRKAEPAYFDSADYALSKQGLPATHKPAHTQSSMAHHAQQQAAVAHHASAAAAAPAGAAESAP